MSKSVRIDDDLYEKIEEFALKEDRPVANALVRLIKLGLGLSEPSENKKVEIPNGVGSQANKRMVAAGSHPASTGNEHMPVRESLPDDLEEALYHFRQISEDLKPEALMRWCHKQSVDEAWTDEQAKIEVDKRKQELLAEREEVAAILKENGVNLGLA